VIIYLDFKKILANIGMPKILFISLPIFVTVPAIPHHLGLSNNFRPEK